MNARRQRVSTARRFRRGAAAVLAMLFLVLFTTLAVAMMELSNANMNGASNLSDVSRAQDAAESGLRFMQYRFLKMARPKTTVGSITATVANSMWPTIKQAISDDFSQSTVGGVTNYNQMLTASERVWSINTNDMTSAAIALDNTGGTFQIHITKHPIGVGDALDSRYIRVSSTGTYRSATRTVAMDFKIDKKIKYAVVGKVTVQIGRDTIVEGDIATETGTTGKWPPVQILSDFQHEDPTMATSILNWEAWLKTHHTGYDGRVAVSNATEYQAAVSSGYTDYNHDGYIDEYDIFAKRFDKNGNQTISASEFTNSSTGALYDANLFSLIDTLGAPLATGDPIRAGYNDNQIDNRDAYGKVKGTLTFDVTEAQWKANLSGASSINDWIQGPVVPTEPNEAPVKFGAGTTDIMDLSPTNFGTCCIDYRAMSGTNAGGSATKTTSGSITTYNNYTITSTQANGTAVVEHTPYGSTTYEATYQRPVFNNVVFKNCIIQKGTNALFSGCTFQGVTFVDFGAATGTYNMTNSATHGSGTTVTDSASGTTWSQRMKTGSFSTGTTLTSSNSYGFTDGNNLRFNNCTFNGPVAGTDASAYAHFSNSWEFTGATLFNNQVDQTATIVCPNTNIEMGSFTDPSQAPSTLVGVVVAGNIDIRGSSVVDGSIIVTGNGAGNTTLGYFGPDDSSSNPTAMPEGGYGKIDIRYNPNRALPDGINIAIDILPNTDSYAEGSDVQ